MLTGLWKLTWVETKIYMREPLGLMAPLLIPVLLFIILGRIAGAGRPGPALEQAPFNVPVLAALLIAVSAVNSLVAIMAIYREAGILKRLRATPLAPVTILGAHVLVKLGFTVIGLALLVLAGRQIFPGALQVQLASFTAALLLSTLSILSLGFVIASLVPTPRFAQPISVALLYPMVALSGLFFPLDRLAPPLRLLALGFPTTHAVALMQGVWDGAGWNPGSAAALVLIFGLCTGISSRLFRWE